MYPCFMSSLVKCFAPLSSYRSSSTVGMTCLVRLINVLAVVMSIFMRICVGSAFGVRTSFDIQSVGQSTVSITPESSNWSSTLSNFSHFANGIFRCGCMISLTCSSIKTSTCLYLCLPMP